MRLFHTQSESQTSSATAIHLRAGLAAAMLVMLNKVVAAEIDATVYVNKHFEVREHDAPTKYVWNRETRVAKVTGSLKDNLRIQRLRLYPGWNLCSLAVTAREALAQLERKPPELPLISDALKWDPLGQVWLPVAGDETLSGGTVLWLKATANATLTISGTYADPANRNVTASGAFLPSTGLEAWDLKSAMSNLPSATTWTYNAVFTRWLSWLPPPLELQSDLPMFIAPGQAAFVHADALTELEVPEAALRIHYYHHDHLGSSSCLSDTNGQLIEESSFYPFGCARFESQLCAIKENYQFTQKERDRESRLNYFESRYQYTLLSRFLSVDPEIEHITADLLKYPQKAELLFLCAESTDCLSGSYWTRCR